MSLCKNVVLILAMSLSAVCTAATEAETQWNAWLGTQMSDRLDAEPVVQNRAVQKGGRFQIVGPGMGFQERGDFNSGNFLTLGTRYHFTETWGWEVLRAFWNKPSPSHLVSEIESRTDYRLDSRPSKFQVSTAILFAPIYGKYAFDSSTLVYFDVYASLGAGLRFITGGQQPFAEIGLGSSQFLWRRQLSITPEFRVRLYSEMRTRETFVAEAIGQINIGWLW